MIRIKRRERHSGMLFNIADCHCGEELWLHSFTEICPKCERMYNPMGQELAPLCFWGEETGESASDILNTDL